MRFEVALELGLDGAREGYLGEATCVQCGKYGHLLYSRAKQLLNEASKSDQPGSEVRKDGRRSRASDRPSGQRSSDKRSDSPGLPSGKPSSGSPGGKRPNDNRANQKYAKNSAPNDVQDAEKSAIRAKTSSTKAEISAHHSQGRQNGSQLDAGNSADHGQYLSVPKNRQSRTAGVSGGKSGSRTRSRAKGHAEFPANP